jgi:DsbC/DsbD-like thiol-disulfide interchange protein
VERDRGEWIQIETATVPSATQAGEPVRLHVMLRPDPTGQAHWNNEGDPTTLWLDLPPGWMADHRRLTMPNPPDAVSLETRTFELEVRPPNTAPTGEHNLKAFVLYGVCEDSNGTCLFRRQDFRVRLDVREQGK